MKLSILIFSLFWPVLNNLSSPATTELHGAWENEKGVVIFSDGFFSYTEYAPTKFLFTYGGMWEIKNEHIILTYEYHTQDSAKVGMSEHLDLALENSSLKLGSNSFKKTDDGTPGKLAGTWLFNNRIRDGELGTPRGADNSRKTMKILSGKRFQWIAYNTETREFSGTGGGTYTTIDGKYTEKIDFFSRDNNRVGASLEFDFEIKNDEWHHQGLSSRGDPIYEIWKSRISL